VWVSIRLFEMSAQGAGGVVEGMKDGRGGGGGGGEDE
jgi:hypothetical protein